VSFRLPAFAECWSDVAPQQALVTAITPLAEFRFRSCIQPPIEKFIQRNLGSFEPAAQVAFAQHFRQVFLGAARSAVDRAIVVAPLPGFALAAEEDADEPAVPPASHDLSRLASQRTSLPKIWHTAGTLAPAMDLSDQLLGGEGEGGAITQP
jgi:hypothetical protein